MSDMLNIRDFIAANSDNASELRARWASEAPKEPKVSTQTFQLSPVQSTLERLVQERAAQIALDAERKELERRTKENLSHSQLYSDYRKAFPDLFTDGATCDGGRIHFSFRETPFSVFRGDKGYYMLQREGGTAKELASPPMPALVDLLTKEFSR
jgi:hypothetical protein